jgi:hypothetical protein
MHSLVDGYIHEMEKINDYLLSSSSGKSLIFLTIDFEKQLATRLDFLTGHSWLTRGESNRNLQLPDLVPIKFINETLDPQYDLYPCHTIVAVLRQGKTNQFSRIEYAGMMRHRDVCQCAVNALAMWLFYKYHLTKIDLRKPDYW